MLYLDKIDELCCNKDCSCYLIEDKFLEKNISKTNNWPHDSAVRFITNLMKLWFESISNFLDGNYHKYDALVGENACQIRGAMLLDFILDFRQDVKKIQEFKDTARTLEQNIKRLNSMDIDKTCEHETFKSFLHRNNLTFTISREIILVTTSYLLTLTKVTMPPSSILIENYTDSKAIQQRGLSYKEAREIIPFYQKLLASLSCDYILQEANVLENQQFSILMVELIDSMGRRCLPLLAVFKVIFSRMLQQNKSIFIHVERRLRNQFVDQVELFYKPNSEKKDFELIKNPSTKTLSLIIGGVVNYENEVESLEDYKTRLQTLSLLNVIYANGAAHPQYPSQCKGMLPFFDEIITELTKKLKKFQKLSLVDNLYLIENQIKQVNLEKNFFYNMKKFSQENGLCLQNPSLFFLNHVYCDMVGRKNFKYQN